MTPSQTLTPRFTHTDAYLWILGILLFIGGDVLTTQIAFTTTAGTEANPIVRYIIYNHGFNAFLGFKTLMFLMVIALWVLAEQIIILEEQNKLDTRIENTLPHPLYRIYKALPGHGSTSNTAFLKAIPTIPLLLGAALTINNTLVITHKITLYEATTTTILSLI